MNISSASIAGRVDLNSLMRPMTPERFGAKQIQAERFQAELFQAEQPASEEGGKQAKTKELFNRWVGMTFYGQLLSEMRKSVGKSAYFHGGRAEEVFQGQLDQQIAESMADASAESFSGPMYDLAMLSRPK